MSIKIEYYKNRHKCLNVSKLTEEVVIANIRVVKFTGIYSPVPWKYFQVGNF